MKKIPVSTSDEELKNIIRQWINLLAEGRYDEAAEIFLPEIIPANGSVDEKQFSKWTGKLLETVIYYGGTAFLYEGQMNFTELRRLIA